jgi:hypothetical protein
MRLWLRKLGMIIRCGERRGGETRSELRSEGLLKWREGRRGGGEHTWTRRSVLHRFPDISTLWSCHLEDSCGMHWSFSPWRLRLRMSFVSVFLLRNLQRSIPSWAWQLCCEIQSTEKAVFEPMDIRSKGVSARDEDNREKREELTWRSWVSHFVSRVAF